MKLVVPTVTAKDSHRFRTQTDLVASISDYAHIDLASSDFNSAEDLVEYTQVYLEPVLTSSVHIMYKNPLDVVKHLLNLPEPPRMIILQAESEDKELLEAIKLVKDSPSLLGISLLQSSQPEEFSQIISMADQVVIFSGTLGKHGGTADLTLLTKVSEIKKIKKDLEIAWDGGINFQNIEELAKGGIDVFYVGSKIHKSADPYQTLRDLQEIVDSTTSSQQS
jgi:ribulose-phosphate 3-epimerase